jgi:hypothetical protein
VKDTCARCEGWIDREIRPRSRWCSPECKTLDWREKKKETPAHRERRLAKERERSQVRRDIEARLRKSKF